MNIQTLHTKINENLSVATKLDEHIYYCNKNTLHATNIYTGQKTTVKEEIVCNYLVSYKNDLLVVDGNRLTIMNKKGYTLKDHKLLHFVKRVKKHNDKVIILTSENDFYRLDNLNLTHIRSTKRPKDIEIIDFEVTDSDTYILCKNNEIYKTASLSTSIFLSYSEKLVIMEYNKLGICSKINVRDNRFYLQYDQGFVIYKRKNNIILPVYEYDNSNYELYFFENVFLVSNGVYLIKDIPERILDDDAHAIFDNVILCTDYVCIFENAKDDTKSCIQHYEVETDPERRVDSLFRNVKFTETTAEKESTEIKEEDCILLMRDINTYKRKYLDLLKIASLELNTLCMSFKDKQAAIDAMKRQIESKMMSVKVIKTRLNKEIVKINNELEEMLSSRSCCGNVSEMKHKIDACKQQIQDIKINNDKTVVQRLKLQRVILKNATK